MAGAIGRGVPHGLVVGIGVAVAFGLGLRAGIGDGVAGPTRLVETVGLGVAPPEQATTARIREKIEPIRAKRTVRTLSSSRMHSALAS